VKKVSVGSLGAVIGLAVLMAPVSAASAQMSPWTASVFVGGLFATGDFGDAANTGWLAGASGGYRFGEGRSPVSLRLDLSYSSSSAKDFSTGANPTVDAKFNNIYVLGFALLHPNIGQKGDKAVVDLYVGGGGGFVNSKCSGADCDVFGTTEDPAGTASETNGALAGVVGGAAPIGGVYLFFEGRWVLVFTSGSSQNLFPVMAGVRIPFGG